MDSEDEIMKKIMAIIRPDKLENVKDSLEKIGCHGLTVKEVKGRGIQLGITESYRGRDYKVDLLPKTEIEIVAKDEDTDKIVDTIVKTGQTGCIGDGKIFVYDITNVIRVRTGDEGEDAL